MKAFHWKVFSETLFDLRQRRSSLMVKLGTVCHAANRLLTCDCSQPSLREKTKEVLSENFVELFGKWQKMLKWQNCCASHSFVEAGCNLVGIFFAYYPAFCWLLHRNFRSKRTHRVGESLERCRRSKLLIQKVSFQKLIKYNNKVLHPNKRFRII